jgi:hypothetical protein
VIEIVVEKLNAKNKDIFKIDDITHVCTVVEEERLLAALAIEATRDKVILKNVLLLSEDARDLDGMIKTSINYFHLEGVFVACYDCGNEMLSGYFKKINNETYISKGYACFRSQDFIESTRCRR